MKSYYVELTGIGESRLAEEEIDIEDLRDDEAVIQAEYSMISAGTELSRAYGLKKGFSYPVRPGYCMTGRIVKKGKDIDAKEGDLVFVNAPHASLVRRSTSDKIQGPLIIRLPEGIDPIYASAINLGLVALQAVNLSKVRLGDSVAVFGLGNIGIFAALMYQKMGCRVIGVDPVEGRRRLAEDMGIEETASDKEEVLKRCAGGVDIAVDVTGLSNVIIDCVAVCRPYGQAVLLGSPRQSYETDVTPFLSAVHMKDIRILGAFNQTVPVYPAEGSDDSMMRNFHVVCGLFMRKDIDVRKMVSRVIDPKDCQKAYHDLMYEKENTGLIVYDWRKYQE